MVLHVLIQPLNNFENIYREKKEEKERNAIDKSCQHFPIQISIKLLPFQHC